MLKAFFESRTFADHMGEPSFGRKAMFCILVFAGVFCLLALFLIAWLDDAKRAKEIGVYAVDLLKWSTGAISVFYTGAQASKGMAQLGGGSPSTPATGSTTTALAPSTTATATSPVPPQPPPLPPATAKTMTAMATSTTSPPEDPGPPPTEKTSL